MHAPYILAIYIAPSVDVEFRKLASILPCVAGWDRILETRSVCTRRLGEYPCRFKQLCHWLIISSIYQCLVDRLRTFVDIIRILCIICLISKPDSLINQVDITFKDVPVCSGGYNYDIYSRSSEITRIDQLNACYTHLWIPFKLYAKQIQHLWFHDALMQQGLRSPQHECNFPRIFPGFV